METIEDAPIGRAFAGSLRVRDSRLSGRLFAAGHLPGTMAMTELTPVLLLRCFLFNYRCGLTACRYLRRIDDKAQVR
jgi:hypothetical protein